MKSSPRPADWTAAAVSRGAVRAVADPRARLRCLSILFGCCLLFVLGRCAQLSLGQHQAYMTALSQPRTKIVSSAAPRGRILSRDGIVLAQDEATIALAVEYRYLQQPFDERWLRRVALREMKRGDRHDEQLVAAVIEQRVEQITAMHAALAELCQLSETVYQTRRQTIERRVERIAASVNTRRQMNFIQSRVSPRDFQEQEPEFVGTLSDAAAGLFVPPAPLPPRQIAVSEQLDHHVIHVGVPLSAVAYIESHPEKFPGVRIETARRRTYPRQALAAHLLGYVGEPSSEQLADKTLPAHALTGVRGAELQFQTLLAGTDGQTEQQLSPTGKLLSKQIVRPAVPGHDLLLSIDSRLQRTAEQLLDAVCQHNAIRPSAEQSARGGAILVMDARTGSLLTLAASPRFDPNAFVQRDNREIKRLLQDTRLPLFDRGLQMALPPGSTWKPLSAIAILEAGQTTAERPFDCQGYYARPDRLRCALYRHQGIGHGKIRLTDALARSCNVYFYHHAGEIGHAPLLGWATQFGFGQLMGIDLPGEASGQLLTPRAMRETRGRSWQPSDTQLTAVGQGAVSATPLQVAVMMAAIANGGEIVTPSVALDVAANQPVHDHQPSSSATLPPRRSGRSLQGLSPQTLDAIRTGLRAAVADEQGTAYRALRNMRFEVAGKTGTAESGGNRPDHAWFAGYAPADDPRLVVVVLLEHGGSGGAIAAPLAGAILTRAKKLKLLRH